MSDKSINSSRWVEVIRGDKTVLIRKKFNTDKEIKAWQPESKRFEVSDDEVKGLRLRVDPNNRKSWVWYYREDGKQHLKSLGEYPEVSLKLARKNLEAAKNKLAEGMYSAQDVPTTVNELAERFYQKRILPHRTRPDAVRQVLDHDILPELGKYSLLTITPIAVNRMIEIVVERGADVHAGKILAVTRQMFGYAVGMGYMDISPVQYQKKKDLSIKEATPRERVLSSDDIQAFWAAIDSAPRTSVPVRYALKILLLSGVRSNELRLAKWAHIDLDAKMWFIPEENSKTRSWTVPLSSHLITHFEALQAFSGGSEWVIPGKSGAVSDKVFNRAKQRLFEMGLLDIQPMTVHDLRRTLRTGLSTLGVQPHIAELCLNHSLGKVYSTYDREEFLSERMDALQQWGDRVDLIVNPRENVILMGQSA
jgi:integrase